METKDLKEDGYYWMRLPSGLVDWRMAHVSIHVMPEVAHINDGRVPHYCAIGMTYSTPCPLDAEFVGPIAKPKN